MMDGDTASSVTVKHYTGLHMKELNPQTITGTLHFSISRLLNLVKRGAHS